MESMRLLGKLKFSGPVHVYSHRTAVAQPYIAFIKLGTRCIEKIQKATIKETLIDRLYLSIDLICLRRHNEIVFVQAFYDMAPPLYNDFSPLHIVEEN
jgi:hypothetical protein